MTKEAMALLEIVVERWLHADTPEIFLQNLAATPKHEQHPLSVQYDTMLKSLEYDPGHAETWLDAAEYTKRHYSASRSYAIVNDAMANLPENVPILVAAMQACGARNAHKKASSLAKCILEIDPINTRVKALRYRGCHRICLGMVLLLQGKEEGLLHIAVGQKENGSPLFGHVLTSLESRLYKLPKGRHREFDRQLPEIFKQHLFTALLPDF